jgi:hypothetical protein
LKAYRDAAKKLITEKYPDLADIAPPHIRAACDCLALMCDDGIIIRWDRHSGDAPKVRVGVPSDETSKTVTALGLHFSEGHVHCVIDPSTFQLPDDGPKMQLFTTKPTTGERTLVVDARIGIVVNWGELYKQTMVGLSRPMPLISLTNEVEMQIGGELFDESAQPTPATGREFLLRTLVRLPVGWESFEIYPPFDPDLWQPGLAAGWAECDILAVAARHSLRKQQLHAVDPRAAARRQYGLLLKEFEGLLQGLESPLQTFLESNPALLSPTHMRMWRKLPFGKRVTDFVFRQPANEYLLVELEAPTRSLFRKDGQLHGDLIQAMNQITDWLRYIEDNLTTVQKELGLTHLSTSPSRLIVIGRSSDLTDDDRRKLTTLQNENPKLRIATYDDLLMAARTTIENLLGPLWDTPDAVEVYYA